MDLQTLKFKVETSELVSAVTAIKNLTTEVSKLNKPVSDAAVASEKLAQSQAKTTTANAKAEMATIKLAKAQEDSNKPLKESVSVLQRQQDILAFMTEGYSKGQSSVLAYAKASGALNDELTLIGATLKTQRTLMGTDPFDKSIGTLEAWTNRLKVANEVQNLYNRNLGLTKGQMEELARDKLRLNELFKDKGVGAANIEYEKLVKVASQTATTINSVTNSVKDQEKWINQTAKANAYLEKEMYRLDTALQETNKDLGSGSVNALIRFENALKQSGMTLAEQTVKLDEFKKKLAETNKQSGNRQVDYLARALGPQITDIGVGLMTGQNPLTVLLQQGGQLRDQLALAGIAGKDMGKALQDAAAGMVGSVKDVGIAVGGLVVNSLASAGKAVIKFGSDITGATFILDKLKESLIFKEAITGKTGLSSVLNGISVAIQVFTGGIVVAAIATLIAMAVSLKEVIKQEGELSRAVTLSGGALGITNDQAIALSKTYAGAKGNVGAFAQAIAASAKAGNISADNLQAVTSAAIDLNKAAGIPIEDTIKQFSKLGEKPTEAIRELAKSTGLISPEIMKAVDGLEKQGKKTEAATLAINSYSDAMKKASSDIQKDMSYLESFFDTVGRAASSMWDRIANAGRKGDLTSQLNAATDELNKLQFASNKDRPLIAAELTKQQAIVDGLKAQVENEEKVAQAKDKSNAFAEFGIKYGKYAEASLSKQARFEAERLKLQEAALKAGIGEAEQAKILAGIRKEIFGEAALPNNLEIAQKGYSEELKMAQSMNDNKRKVLKFYYDIGLKDRSEYVTEDTKLLEQSESSQLAVVEKFQKQFADAYAIQYKALSAKSGAGSQDVKNLTATFEELNKSLENTKKGIADTVTTRSIENMRAIGEVIKQSKDAYIDFSKTVASSANQRSASYEAEKELAGAYGASAERIKAYRDEYNKLIPAITAAEQRIKQAEKNLEGSPKDTEQAALAQKALDQTRLDSTNTLAAAKIAAAKAADDAEARYNDMSLKRLNAYNDAFSNVFQGMGDAILNFVKTGEFSFKGLIDSMLSNLIRFELQAQMSSLYQTTGGSLGILNTIKGVYSGMTGGQYTPGSENFVGPMPQALGGAWNNGVQAFAKGGSFTNSIVDSPTLFKFAKGTGLMGEAGPEAIMPLRRGPDGSLGVQSQGGGSNVSVSIINNTNAQATTQETTDSRGNRKVEVIIGDMTAGEVTRSGSSSQKAMKSTYGIQPALIRR
jgi:lambda family phage tail tape measure protein